MMTSSLQREDFERRWSNVLNEKRPASHGQCPLSGEASNSNSSNSDLDSNHENSLILQMSTPMLEIHRGTPIRLQAKVLVPVADHPNYNFIGKLLGPKGNSFKWLQEQTQTKMAILGRGSMRDKQKEEELRILGDAKFFHLREELHVEVTAFAPAAIAYQRLGHALAEVQRFLVPDYYDEIRQQQLRELGILTTSAPNCSNSSCSEQTNNPRSDSDAPRAPGVCPSQLDISSVAPHQTSSASPSSSSSVVHLNSSLNSSAAHHHRANAVLAASQAPCELHHHSYPRLNSSSRLGLINCEGPANLRTVQLYGQELANELNHYPSEHFCCRGAICGTSNIMSTSAKHNGMSTASNLRTSNNGLLARKVHLFRDRPYPQRGVR